MGLDVWLVGRNLDVFQEELGPKWDRIIKEVSKQTQYPLDLWIGDVEDEEMSERIGPYGTLHLRVLSHLDENRPRFLQDERPRPTPFHAANS